MDLKDRMALKPDEAARLLGFGTSKVYDMMRKGQIPCIDLGGVKRIPRLALERLLNGEEGS